MDRSYALISSTTLRQGRCYSWEGCWIRATIDRKGHSTLYKYGSPSEYHSKCSTSSQSNGSSG